MKILNYKVKTAKINFLAGFLCFILEIHKKIIILVGKKIYKIAL